MLDRVARVVETGVELVMQDCEGNELLRLDVEPVEHMVKNQDGYHNAYLQPFSVGPTTCLPIINDRGHLVIYTIPLFNEAIETETIFCYVPRFSERTHITF